MAERGGRRQGTPGVAYTNRTDLAMNRAPVTGTTTPAAGGVQTLNTNQAQPMVPPDAVPRLNDPTARPSEPITTGLDMGPGQGSHALGYVPPSPAIQSLQAAYIAFPTPELRRAIDMLSAKGAL